jgi:hypothetical protein
MSTYICTCVSQSWSFHSFLGFSHSLAINLSLECFLVDKSACCNVVISNLVCVRQSQSSECGLHNPEVHICASYWCWFVLQCPSWHWHKVVAFVLSRFLYMHPSLDIPCVSQVSSFMLQSVSIFQQHCCWKFLLMNIHCNICHHKTLLYVRLCFIYPLYILFNAALVFSSLSHSLLLQRHNQNPGIFEW